MVRRIPLVVALLAAVAVAGAAAVGFTHSALRSTTSNPSSGLSAAGAFCTRSSAIWLTGMEPGVVSTAGGGIFTTLTGAPTADNGTVRNGAYSLRINDAAAGSTVNALRTFTASSVVVVRFALRLSALPAVSSSLAYIDSATDLVLGYDQPTQKLQLTQGASSALSASTVSAATWYVIDLRYDLRSNPILADWRIDGVAQPQVSRAAAAATATGVGLGATTNAGIYTANYDDIFVANQATAYPVGDGKVVALVPNGVGTHSGAANFRNDDGSAVDANSWQRLDEVPMASTADYVRQQANSGTSYVELALANTSETCIREISAVLAYHAATNAANNAKASLFDGATESTVFSGDMGSNTLRYASVIATPASARWSPAAVNGLLARVGFGTDTTPNPYWDALMLEAATA